MSEEHQTPLNWYAGGKDADVQETEEWLTAFEQVIEHEGSGRACFLLQKLLEKGANARQAIDERRVLAHGQHGLGSRKGLGPDSAADQAEQCRARDHQWERHLEAEQCHERANRHGQKRTGF